MLPSSSATRFCLFGHWTPPGKNLIVQPLSFAIETPVRRIAQLRVENSVLVDQWPSKPTGSLVRNKGPFLTRLLLVVSLTTEKALATFGNQMGIVCSKPN
jgi:hypothetical protein